MLNRQEEAEMEWVLVFGFFAAMAMGARMIYRILRAADGALRHWERR